MEKHCTCFVLGLCLCVCPRARVTAEKCICMFCMYAYDARISSCPVAHIRAAPSNSLGHKDTKCLADVCRMYGLRMYLSYVLNAQARSKAMQIKETPYHVD